MAFGDAAVVAAAAAGGVDVDVVAAAADGVAVAVIWAHDANAVAPQHLVHADA